MMEYRLLKLDKSLRSRLKKPFGRLLKDVRDLETSSHMLICVGDRVSEEALNAGLRPKIIVYDGKVMREDVEIPSVILDYPGREVRVKNPPGSLTSEVFEVLEEALGSDSQSKIFVDGEEDMVSVAAVSLAPLGSTVIYGQPDEGLVVVEVNEDSKMKVEKIMEQMV